MIGPMIVDAPPIVSITDAAVVGARTDGAMLVVRMGSTPREVVGEAVELLKKARVNVLGTVLTHLSPVMKDYYYYPYGN